MRSRMRQDWVVKGGTGQRGRFRFTATRVRREVILDVPLEEAVDLFGGDRHHRLRFTLAEAEAFLALFVKALASARE